MKTDSTTLEARRVKNLARDYQRKGYHVTIPSSPSDVPGFLEHTRYVPDLIAAPDSSRLEERDHLIIEVKTKSTARSLDRLSSVSELVNSQPGWKFVLVITNPRHGESPDAKTALDVAQRLLDKGQRLGSDSHTHTEASFLFTWIALETVLKAFLRTDLPKKTVPSDGRTLVRNAAMAGQIDRDDVRVLDRFYAIRNALLHGGDAQDLHDNDVAALRTLVKKTLRQANEPYSEQATTS